jgi:hypothetical protein
VRSCRDGTWEEATALQGKGEDHHICCLMPDRLVPLGHGGGLSVSVLPEKELLQFRRLDRNGVR